MAQAKNFLEFNRMDIYGRFYKEVRHYREEEGVITCRTKGCFRHNKRYNLEVRGSDHCDNCGATMKPIRTYYTERIYS